MIRMTLVHGNDDVVVEEFNTLREAHAAAMVLEDERHGTEGKPLREAFPMFEHTDAGRAVQQFGTNYHYVTFEEE